VPLRLQYKYLASAWWRRWWRLADENLWGYRHMAMTGGIRVNSASGRGWRGGMARWADRRIVAANDESGGGQRDCISTHINARRKQKSRAKSKQRKQEMHRNAVNPIVLLYIVAAVDALALDGRRRCLYGRKNIARIRRRVCNRMPGACAARVVGG